MRTSASIRDYFRRICFTLLACGCAYVGLAVAQLGAPTAMTATTAHYARLQEQAAACRGRKLLYASGSSGFYGVRCSELSRLIGRPAVNFGLHAGLGLRYLMDRCLAAASAGDVIVLGPEWETYQGPRFGEYACDYIMSRRPDYFSALPINLAAGVVISGGPQRVLSGVYSLLLNGRDAAHAGVPPEAVNEHGDRILTARDLERRKRNLIKTSAILPSWRNPPRELVADVAAFAVACRKKQVQAVVVFPPMCVTAPPDAAQSLAAEQGVRALWESVGIPVLGEIDEAFYRPDDAFDTPYHLDQEAAIRHTLNLACLFMDSTLPLLAIPGIPTDDEAVLEPR